MTIPTEFIFEHFPLFFAFCVTWSVGWMGWGLWKRKQRGQFQQPPDGILYEEKMASGRSMKTWYTRLGGANNCLRLVITNSELWVTLIFPFSAMADRLDLEHRIALKAIKPVQLQSSFLRKSLRVSFQGQDHEEHTIEVTPRHMDRFASALRERGVPVDAI